MRFAYVCSQVFERDALATGLVDAEWLLARAEAGDEIIVCADEEGTATQALRAEDIPVHISAKRNVDLGEGGIVSADHAQARLLSQIHLDAPLDFILQSTDHGVDPAWHEEALGQIPLIVTAGGDILRNLRLVLDDPHHVLAHGREAWAVAGFVASADAVVGLEPIERYGLNPGVAPQRLVPTDWTPPTSDMSNGDVRLVVVVATTEDRTGLGSIIRRAVERVPIQTETSIVVVAPDLKVGRETTLELIVAGCPPDLVTRTVVVPPGNDGSAASFIATADMIVAARSPDRELGAVQDAAATTPVVLLDHDPSEHAALLGTTDMRPRNIGPRMLIPIDGRPWDVASLLQDAAEAEFAIFHTPHGTEQAVRLLTAARIDRSDLIVLGRPHPVTGAFSTKNLYPHVLGVHSSVLPSLTHRMKAASSLWELIVWCMGLSLMDSVALSVLPAPVGSKTIALPVEDVAGLPAWLDAAGLLPRPNLAEVRMQSSEPTLAASAPDASVRAWAREHRWPDRARLALPWKWGVLRRAMKGRW